MATGSLMATYKETDFLPDQSSQGKFSEADFLPDQHTDISASLQQMQQQSLWQKATTQNLQGKTDPLALIARAGQFANQGNQQLMQGAAEGMGRMGVNPYVSAAITTPYATASQFLMPQNRLGAGMAVLPAVAKGVSSAYQGAKSMLGLGEEAAQGASNTSGIVSQGVGQTIRAASGVPVKSATAAANDLGMLSRAKTPEELSDAYSQFESANGLKGLKATMRENWQDMSANDLKDMVLNAAKKVEAGKDVGKQDLYLASQAARKIRDLAKIGNPDALAAMNGELVSAGKGVIDSALENAAPGYKALRQMAFESNVAEDFNHLFPQNQNLSPNVLRTTGALGAAMSGHPGAIAAVSPMFWGALLRNAGSLKNPQVLNALRQTGIGASNALSQGGQQ